MFTQKFNKIFHSVQEIGPFHFFGIWHSAKPRSMINVIFLWLDFFNIKLSAKFYQNIPNGLRVKFHFFFRIWTSAKPRPIPIVIWQSHGLHLVNTNVCAKFHHNIPLSSRDRAIFTFSEFGARQSLDQSQMSFDYLMGYIMSISMCMQNFVTIRHSVQEIGHFHFFRIWSSAKPRPMKNVISQSLGLDLVNINVYTKVYQIFHSVPELRLFSLFQNLNLGNASAIPKWYLTISWATSC